MSNILVKNENLRQMELKRKDLTLEQKQMINAYYDNEIIRINEEIKEFEEPHDQGTDEAKARTRRPNNKKRGSVR